MVSGSVRVRVASTRMPTDVRTEEQTGPMPPAETSRGREALLVVFPTSVALPVPPSGEAVGRDWLARFHVSDPKSSRDHIVLSRAGGVLRVADCGSRNGTWVNGQRLAPNEPVALDDGAVLRLGRTLLVYREELFGPDAAEPPLGALVSPFGMRAVRVELERMLSPRPPTNVLIEGETGTGKELVAAAIAERLGRAKRFAAVNVASIPAGVFDSQLFGYVPGAFSGGGKGSRGIFLAHDGGVVFLDEIGELPLDLQPKLLRLLDNREVFQVGATEPKKVDLVVVAATNRPLAEMVDQGTFRRDLLARLSAARVELPPLRERPEDILAIILAESAKRGTPLEPGAVEVEAVERLMLHAWPANVRELISVLHRVAAIDAPTALRAWAVDRVLGPRPQVAGVLTRAAVEQALARTRGNESAAARVLGVTRGKLRRLLTRTRG